MAGAPEWVVQQARTLWNSSLGAAGQKGNVVRLSSEEALGNGENERTRAVASRAKIVTSTVLVLPRALIASHLTLDASVDNL